MSSKCQTFVQHDFRKICANCKGTEADHPFDPLRINSCRISLELEQEPPLPDDSAYLWNPRRCPDSKLEEFFRSLPRSKVPIIGLPGEKLRERQWVIQIPDVDLAANRCKFMDDEEKAKFQAYIDKRNEKNVDEAIVTVISDDLPKECLKCQNTIEFGELMVTSPKQSNDYAWHPRCFICIQCGEQPVDFIHCIGKYGRVFCIRHFDEQSKPRCDGCDELIYDHEHTKALNRNWHVNHFCCFECDTPLAGIKFYSQVSKPYCKSCYDKLFRHNCIKCNQKISIDQPEFSSKDEHWHEDCFNCEDCSASLSNSPFARHDGKVYCGNCYESKYADRCEKCGIQFKLDNLKLEYKGTSYHKECFTCCKCELPIKEKTFIPEQEGFYCIPCYRESHAIKCDICKKPISKGGVSFRNQNFHKGCFTCDYCKKELEETVILKNEKAFCKNCYGLLFAKKCTVCKEPIMGNDKYMNFQENNWHLNCFRCVNCGASLMGQAYTATEEGILCLNCTMEDDE